MSAVPFFLNGAQNPSGVTISFVDVTREAQLESLRKKNATELKFVLDGVPLNNQITIGHDRKKSGTTLPSFYGLDDPVFCDCPGFEDVAGKDAEIFNAFTKRSIFNPSHQVKVVLVLDEKELDVGRSGNIVKLFNQLDQMFPNTNKAKTMLSMVITKQSSNPDEIVEDLERTSNALTEGGKELLTYLCENHQSRIAYLPESTAEGPYNINPAGILTKIGNAQYVEGLELNIALPGEAREHLRHLSEEINGRSKNCQPV